MNNKKSIKKHQFTIHQLYSVVLCHRQTRDLLRERHLERSINEGMIGGEQEIIKRLMSCLPEPGLAFPDHRAEH